MRIKLNNKQLTKITNVKPGDCFKMDDHIYMLILVNTDQYLLTNLSKSCVSRWGAPGDIDETLQILNNAAAIKICEPFTIIPDTDY